jgi:hypothetical protein
LPWFVLGKGSLLRVMVSGAVVGMVRGRAQG